MRIKLIRPVDEPGGSGPMNGQYALQRALAAAAPDWFSIGDDYDPATEIPWFWCWLDRARAVECDRAGRPFVVGPNMLFANWQIACAVRGEREICHSRHCRLMFTESAWYRDWIHEHYGPANRAPIVLWPYPIDPLPDGPLPIEYDVLLYAKNGGWTSAQIESVALHFRRLVVFRYTPEHRYYRQDLLDAARRSAVCAYLSESDRGPLALAEIMLAGCPAVGTARGAPWCEIPVLGRIIEPDDHRGLVRHLKALTNSHRPTVRQTALRYFDAGRTVRTIFDALDQARR